MRTMKEVQFYSYKDGSKMEICKKCLTMHVDPYKSETFTPLLERVNVPYVPSEWEILIEKARAKDPSKVSGRRYFPENI